MSKECAGPGEEDGPWAEGWEKRSGSSSRLNDLLPCPFCGGEARTKYTDDLEWLVRCDNPDCMIMPEAKGFETDDDAKYAWNERAR